MDEWRTDCLPDFTVHGFHLGKTVRYRLKDGTEHEGVYQGWGLFGAGQTHDWDLGEVIAWSPSTSRDE